MLGHDNHALHACLLEGPHPLLHIHPTGIEHLGVGIAIAPLAIVEGIQPIVHKGIRLHLLPLHLLRLGQRSDRSLGKYR